MTTSELINLLKSVEFAASNRPREISFVIDDKFISEPDIIFNGSGDGIAGAQLSLLIKPKDGK